MFDDSDYVVEEYIKPSKVRKRIINDERADIFGNFEDEKDKLSSKKGVKKTKVTPVLSEENPFEDDSDGNEDDNGMDEDDVVQDDTVSDENEGEQENETGEENESDEVDNESDEEASDSDDPAGSDGEESSNDIDDEGTDEVTPAEKPSKNSKQAPAQNNGNSQKSKSATQNEKPKSKAAKAEKPKSNGAQKTSKLELTDDQLKALIRGSSKQDRFVLYVTNLNYSTTRDTLTEFFSAAGPVKSVRIPKVRRGAFAFIEMSDVNGFKVSAIKSLQSKKNALRNPSSNENMFIQ